MNITGVLVGKYNNGGKTEGGAPNVLLLGLFDPFVLHINFSILRYFKITHVFIPNRSERILFLQYTAGIICSFDINSQEMF